MAVKLPVAEEVLRNILLFMFSVPQFDWLYIPVISVEEIAFTDMPWKRLLLMLIVEVARALMPSLLMPSRIPEENELVSVITLLVILELKVPVGSVL